MGVSKARVYANYFANWLSKGGLIDNASMSLIGIKPSFDRIITRDYIRKVWVVSYLPINFNVNFNHLIRSEMSKRYPTCKIIMHTYNKPVNIPIGSKQFLRNKERAYSRYAEYQRIFSQFNSDEQITGKVIREKGMKISIRPQELERIRNKYESYRYVFTNVQAGETFMQTIYAVEVLVPDRKTLKKFEEDFRNLCNSALVVAKPVKGNISVFLKNFGIAGYPGFYGNYKVFPKLLFSPDNLSRQSAYKTRGVIGDGGVLMGINFKNKTPLVVNFFKSQSGQTMLVLGESGAGKSHAVKQFTLSTCKFGAHCGVLDIKGHEYDEVRQITNGINVCMDSINPRFVNTLRLDDILVGETFNSREEQLELAAYYYTTAVEGTVEILSVMSQVTTEEKWYSDMRQLLEKAVRKLYSQHNIDMKNPETFEYSENLSFSDVISIIDSFKESSSLRREEVEICRLLKSRCSVFLEDDGPYSDAFKNELTLRDIIDSKFVQYSFNKNDKENLTVMDGVRVVMVQYIERKKQAYRKRHGLQTVEIVEEYQRCSHIPGLEKAVASNVTGARSLNTMTVIIGNSLSMLDSVDSKPIVSNITTFLLGSLRKMDRDRIVNNFELERIRSDLDRIAEKSEYFQSFILDYKIGSDRNSCVYKVDFPDYLNKMLETKDVVEV